MGADKWEDMLVWREVIIERKWAIQRESRRNVRIGRYGVSGVDGWMKEDGTETNRCNQNSLRRLDKTDEVSSSKTKKRENSLLANGLTLSIFLTILLIPVLLSSSFSLFVTHHSFLTSLPVLCLSLHSSTYFPPPLSVIGKGQCTHIHLIKCAHTHKHTILTDILLSCSKMNLCVDWITSRLSQDPLYLMNVGEEREKENKMKAFKRKREINYPVCWCKPFCCTLRWAVLGCTHMRTHRATPHFFLYSTLVD